MKNPTLSPRVAPAMEGVSPPDRRPTLFPPATTLFPPLHRREPGAVLLLVSLSSEDRVIVSPHSARILVIEDDVLLADLLGMGLRLNLKPAELLMFHHGRAGLAQCRVSKPDLLIVDLGLPDMDGREVIRSVRAFSPGTRIIVLTGQIAASLPGQLIALGVSGYVDKGSTLEHIETAVKRVLDGGIYFSAGNRAGACEPISLPKWDGPPPEVLTEREREIVRLVGDGMLSKEIGDRLQLSRRTVEKARSRISEKLQVRDLPSLIKWSVQHGVA